VRAREWILEYARMVARLRSQNPGRVRGGVRVLVSEKDLGKNELREFWMDLGRTGAGKALAADAQDASFNMARYLAEFGNALVYGSDPSLAAAEDERFVRSSDEVNPEAELMVAILVSYELAGVPGRINAELLRDVPRILPGALKYTSGVLRIEHTALELAYHEYKAGQIFASMA
jgi:hypothetical protein